MAQITLATTSQFRIDAFNKLGIPFQTRASEVDEYFQGRPLEVHDLVTLLSTLKAEAVAPEVESGIVIGFDSVAWWKGQILEKPKTREEAFQRLQNLSNGIHFFMTGVCIINLDTGETGKIYSVTEVQMRMLRDWEINRYLDQDPDFMKCALGYNPLGFYSSTFVKSIKGSFTNLLHGVPLEEIAEYLTEIN